MPWVAALLSACFGEAPGVGGGETGAGQSESGSTADVDATDSAPTSTSATTAGTMEGTSADDSSSGDPCEPTDPQCVGPGETLWNVEIGEAGNDGAYAVIVDGDNVIFGGEITTGPNNQPWMVALALADGSEAWQTAGDVGEGSSVVRGVTPVGDGTVAGVGTSSETESGSLTWLDVRDASGDAIANHVFAPATFASLLGADVANDRLWIAGLAKHTADQVGFPLLLSYRTAGADPWTLEFDSVQLGQLEAFEGALFDVAVTPAGEIVAAGYVLGDGQDATVMLFSEGGELIDAGPTVGGAFDDGFTGLAIDDDGTGIAIGRDGTGATTADVLILRFTVAGGIVEGTQTTWGDAAFTSVNGFARDGDTLFMAAGTSDDPTLSAPAFDTAILRWDGDADAPTWVQTYAPDAPGRDYGSDVALAPDGTIVACGVMTPEGTTEGNAWVRRLGR